MAYRKPPSRSRRYQRPNSGDNNLHNDNSSIPVEHALALVEPVERSHHVKHEEPVSSGEKKRNQPFGFLSSLFGSGDKDERKNSSSGFLSSIFGSKDRAERSGKPLFTILDYDIYLDDLILAGLIILLLTDKAEDEILLLILVYLLLDIF